MEEYRCGIWKKVAKSGVKYCTGKIKIGDREYQVRLFNNDKKGNDKAPDFNLIIKSDVEIKKEENKVPSDEVFKQFGDQIEIDESELAF